MDAKGRIACRDKVQLEIGVDGGEDEREEEEVSEAEVRGQRVREGFGDAGLGSRSTLFLTTVSPKTQAERIAKRKESESKVVTPGRDARMPDARTNAGRVLA